MTTTDTILRSGQPPTDVSDAPILTPHQLEAFTAEKPFDEALVFETSGSTGAAKRIPYSNHAQAIQRKRAAECHTIMGMTEDDVVLSLGAPLDPHKHQSGWAIEQGTKAVGATLANTSFTDYETVLDTETSHQITVVAGLPQTMRTVGRQIEATHGSLDQLFPNLRFGMTGGDLLTANLRAQVQAQWGFEGIRHLYAATEAGMVAAAPDGTNHLRPVADASLILEILPEHNGGYESAPVNIHAVEEPTRGALLVSDLERDIVPIVRYRIGDIVTVYPDTPTPRIEVHGREGETMVLGGALLYPSQIDGALADTHPTAPPNWVAVVSQPDGIAPALDIFVMGDDVTANPDAVRHHLFERSSPVKETYNLDIIDHLHVHYTAPAEIDAELQAFDLVNEVPGDGPKTERIGFDRSYEGVLE